MSQTRVVLETEGVLRQKIFFVFVLILINIIVICIITTDRKISTVFGIRLKIIDRIDKPRLKSVSKPKNDIFV